jgi:bacterioferritin (cytochrome b1)
MRTRGRRTAAQGTRGEIVDELNRLMAEEAEACLRYFQMRYRLPDREYVAAAPLFDEAIRETLEHAATIAEHIKALGHVPTLRVNLTLGGGPTRLETALAEALDVEQQALDAYKDLLPRVAGDAGLEAFVRRQVEVETEHVTEMRAFADAHAKVRLVPEPSPRARPARRTTGRRLTRTERDG